MFFFLKFYVLVQITQIYSDSDLDLDTNTNTNTNLKVSRVSNNNFKVYGPNSKFYWVVYGKRIQVSMEIEPLVSNTEVGGNGPYLYIKNISNK